MRKLQTGHEPDSPAQIDPIPQPVTSASNAGLDSRRRRWRRRVFWALAALLALLLGFVALTSVKAARGYGDPYDVGKRGNAAIVALLEQQGVKVSIVDDQRRLSGVTGATVVLHDLRFIRNEDIADIVAAHPERIVIITEALVEGHPNLPLHASYVNRPSGSQVYEPDCDLPEATRAGRVMTNRRTGVAVNAEGTFCYASSGAAPVARIMVDGVPLWVLSNVVSNDQLQNWGNAALAMNVLGHNEQLVWIRGTDLSDLDQGGNLSQDIYFLPPWFWWSLGALGVAGALTAWWRGKRFGPVLSERLPSVVSASETVEGHGRLAHRVHGREQAATDLRTATIHRLGNAYGGTDPVALATQIAARTGNDEGFIRELLIGAPPTSDEDLVTLKKNLDELEQEARSL